MSNMNPLAIQHRQLLRPMNRRDFGFLRARVPDGYSAVELNENKPPRVFLPGKPLPIGLTVRDPRSWSLVLTQPFAIDLLGLVLHGGKWHRIRIPTTLEVTDPGQFAEQMSALRPLTTATLGKRLNKAIRDEIMTSDLQQSAETDLDTVALRIRGIIRKALESSILPSMGLELRDLGDPETTPVAPGDVPANLESPYALDEERGELSWLLEEILGTQGYPVGERLPSVAALFEGVLRLIQWLVALTGLVSVIWPHRLSWSDIRVPSYVASFTAATLFLLLFFTRRYWATQRNLRALSTYASGDDSAQVVFPGSTVFSQSYRYRLAFWDNVYRALVAGGFDMAEAAASNFERLVRRLRPNIQRAALSDIEALYGDLAVAPSDPIERRAFFLARILLTRRAILNLDRVLSKREVIPGERELFARLDRDLKEGREILRKAIEQYRSLGIEPKRGVLAPRQSLANLVVERAVRTRFAQGLRNRTSSLVYLVFWLITRPLAIANVLWPILRRLFWFLYNRASSVAAGIVWVFAGIIRHPVRSVMIALIFYFGLSLYRAEEVRAAIREWVDQISVTQTSVICPRLSSLRCPFHNPNAQRLCFWSNLPMCRAITEAHVSTPAPHEDVHRTSTPTATFSPTPDLGSRQSEPMPIITPTKTPRPTPTWTTGPTATNTPTPKTYPQCSDGRVVLTEPALYTVVTNQVVFRGTATHQNFWYYKLELGVGTDPDQWSWLDLPDYKRAPVKNDVLGTWTIRDPAGRPKVPPGIYTIRLVVVDKTGNYPEPCRTIIEVK